MTDGPRSYRLRAGQRLRGREAFAAVYAQSVRRNVGPMAVLGRPNNRGCLRLGLSVSRRVGTAVVRNRIKRLLREAFRLCQHDWPQGYDVVVVVYPHQPMRLAEYQRLLFNGIRGIHLEWRRRVPPPRRQESVE